MKQAFITPTKYLSTYAAQGDLYLALAHLIEGEGEDLNEYGTWHREAKLRGATVYLDNGLFEGAQVAPDELIKKAVAINADLVCAPDVLFDSKGTIKAFKEFIKLKHEMGLVAKVMGIPQADNPGDWWDCYQFMDMNKECSVVGLSILSVPKAFERSSRALSAVDVSQPIAHSRKYLIEQLYILATTLDRRLTPMHLLGLGESYDDIRTANYLLSREIISNDSSSVFVHGYNGVAYNTDGTIPGGKIEEKLDFGIEDVTEKQHELIMYNFEIARKMANDDSSRR